MFRKFGGYFENFYLEGIGNIIMFYLAKNTTADFFNCVHTRAMYVTVWLRIDITSI